MIKHADANDIKHIENLYNQLLNAVHEPQISPMIKD